jgi:hypothetical protein
MYDITWRKLTLGPSTKKHLYIAVLIHSHTGAYEEYKRGILQSEQIYSIGNKIIYSEQYPMNTSSVLAGKPPVTNPEPNGK